MQYPDSTEGGPCRSLCRVTQMCCRNGRWEANPTTMDEHIFIDSIKEHAFNLSGCLGLLSRARMSKKASACQSPSTSVPVSASIGHTFKSPYSRLKASGSHSPCSFVSNSLMQSGTPLESVLSNTGEMQATLSYLIMSHRDTAAAAPLTWS